MAIITAHAPGPHTAVHVNEFSGWFLPWTPTPNVKKKKNAFKCAF